MDTGPPPPLVNRIKTVKRVIKQTHMEKPKVPVREKQPIV